MGREVRKVPPNWEHPRDEYGHPQPMHDRNFEEAAIEWKDSLAKWEAGEKLDNKKDDGSLYEYWEWNGDPPDRKYYRTWTEAEATWFQLWETISEGTPVSPPFPTKEELIQYLAVNGDEWDQKWGDKPWGIEAATAFVNSGWFPSMAIIGGKLLQSKDIPLFEKERIEALENREIDRAMRLERDMQTGVFKP